MTEPDKQAIERANSYRQMMEQWAWKDFHSIIEKARQSALEQTIWATTLESIQESRGRVKAIDDLLGELGFILNGAT